MTTDKYSTLVKAAEIVSSVVESEIGDVVSMDIAQRGTTLAGIRHNSHLIVREDVVEKHCLATHIPGLMENTTVVHIPRVDIHGKALDMAQWQQAFWFACGKFGVPTWTQSGIKGLTFEFIRPDFFKKFVSHWNLKTDGRRFAAYGGLFWSESDGDPAIKINSRKIVDPLDGEDGNAVMPPEIWGNMSMWFRGMRLDPHDHMPIAVSKGIGVPVDDTEKAQFNTTQVKWGSAGSFLVVRNKNISARPIKMWISAEPLLMLRDTPEVRQFVAARVEREVSEYLSLLTEENRPALIKRLGGLSLSENGELESAKRAVIEALRANVPWCKEIEERITRFAIKEICESIIPSGAIRGYASLMVISDTHGVGPCKWKDAKVIAFRIPVTGANAIIPLPKDPFVKNKGNVVTSEVAAMASGDADGDLLIVIRDPEIVELFRIFLNRKIVTPLKPEKAKAIVELTPEFLTDMAITQVSNAWMVGGLSVGGWKMIQDGDFEMASKLLDWANQEPMTYKHMITINGVPFAEYVNNEYGKLRKRLAGITLKWREKIIASAKFSSPREIAENWLDPVDVSSHLDSSWNAAVLAAMKWANGNPLKPLSLTKIARVAFGERGVTISGSAWREAREMINWWGKYWHDVHEANGLDGDHSMVYQHAHDWAKNASHEAIAAMLVWRPQNAENSGFSLKWHTVFAAGRAVEVLGLHPAVAGAIMDLRDEKTNLSRLEAMVDALIESIEL